MADGRKVANGFIWRLLERFGAQGVTLVVSLILARILNVEDYGTVALVSIFTSILSVFVTCGLNDALIQKKDADDLDFSTVFYFNIVMCLTMYALMFFGAPLMAKYYHRPDLVPYIRVLSLILVFGGIKNIQSAYVSKNLLFKRFFFATLIGTVAAAGAGIYMALKGYGAWALIVQNLVNNALDTTILWITVKWRPKKMFSGKRLKTLFSYAWKLLVSALVDTVYARLYQLVIAKKYDDEALAYYNKGDTFPYLLVTSINAATDSVLLPVMSEAQNEPERVKAMTRRAISFSSFVIMPMMMGLGVCSEAFVRLVLLEKWLPAVPFIRIFCFGYAFYCVHTANLNAIKALGRSDLFLKLEIIKKCVGIVILLISMQYGVMAMALSSLISSIIDQVINSWPNRKLLGYSYADQLKDMLPNFLLTLAMGLIVYSIYFLHLPDLATLLIQIPLGVIVYALGAKLFHLESFDYALALLKKRRETSAES
ncbi:MAG: lipopolysaccharide biosynthesis protein [Lachnospiraceae bacterium]|nr:lipopolysaccharide biosynthesis protein [Lachnospiraceae bacterium]